MTPTPANPLLHVTVAAIIEQDGRFLVVEEIDNAKAVYNQPAGHVEAHESLIEAVVRETLEEAACDFQPEWLTGIYRWQHPETDAIYLRHCFSGKLIKHHPQRPLDKTILRTHWLSLQELQHQENKLRSPLVLACIEDYLAGQRFPLTLYRQLD
jgi:8-oxo-dGTP pyrophosphatase MutT (NUDIX family)